MRLYTLLGRDHTTLLYAGSAAGADDVAGLESAADAVVQAAHGQMDVYLVAAQDADVAGTCCP
jgi:pentachlorophenol monooxygenase